ncbi:MAG: 16S rRNA (uracil(1498)-N(3))-methyltransferase [Terrimesophilobacter sp.]
MAHFYLSESASDAAEGDTVAVTGAEARHAVTVGRLRVGERLSVGDGTGTIVDGIVSLVDPERFELTVETSRFHLLPAPAIWLAQALAKGDRDELAIQTATELGVDGVIPWAAHRSIVRWDGAKVAKHRERWTSILREASKQSMRARIPELRPVSTTKGLAQLGSQWRIVVLDPTADVGLGSLTLDDRDILLVVGPEGGIAPAEQVQLASAGAIAATLGPHVLRTSTAGPAALAVLSTTLGRW